MFCYQCEQTAKYEGGAGCNSTKGVCGKTADTSDLQDILIYALKGVAQYSQQLRKFGIVEKEVGPLLLKDLFTTLTNVNFNPARFQTMIREVIKLGSILKAKCDTAAELKGETYSLSGPAEWLLSVNPDTLDGAKELAAINTITSQQGADVAGLHTMIIYGLKGCAAYSYHAFVLGKESEENYNEFESILAYLASNPSDINDLVKNVMRVGALNLKVLELLQDANTSAFGQPVPTQVLVTPKAGKCILVSGHDMNDLHHILEQTKDLGINVYTHGELLPALSYPSLQKYPHLVGNYGGAWQDQQTEFATFPGPIVMTSNCIIEPAPSYKQRIFTAGPVGWPGCRHIENDDYSQVIAIAKAMPGFKEDAPEQRITIGFGKETVFGVAGDIINAVKAGDIKHFFLIGGCDGAAPGRNYYTEFAENVPKDAVILTLGCGKFRFNKMEFGSIGGIPRLIDLGQCNDSYTAIQTAIALSQAFECGVNDLPLTLVVSWFEQKAVAVLLTLLHLGLKNIHLGPTLPGFVTPAVLDVLVQNFNLKPIGDAKTDLANALAR